MESRAHSLIPQQFGPSKWVSNTVLSTGRGKRSRDAHCLSGQRGTQRERNPLS